MILWFTAIEVHTRALCTRLGGGLFLGVSPGGALLRTTSSCIVPLVKPAEETLNKLKCMPGTSLGLVNVAQE